MKKKYINPDVLDITINYVALLCSSANDGVSENFSDQETINNDFNWE